MGGGNQTQTQETTTTLPGNQQRNVDVLLQEALNYFRGGGREFFPGDTVANFDPFQTQGQNTLVDFATGTGQELVSGALEGNQFFTNPENIFNPENIPGFQGVTEAITRQHTDNLLQNILPQIRGGGTASGQFGGSASGIGQGLAVGQSQQALGDSLSNLNLGAYQLGLDSFNQALNRAPSLFALGAAPGSLVSGVGAERQAQDQREIGGERERFSFEQNEPAIILSLLQSLTGGAGQFGGTTTTTSETDPGSSGLLQGLGTALTLAIMLGSGGSAVPGLAAAGGAKGGGTAPNATGPVF